MFFKHLMFYKKTFLCFRILIRNNAIVNAKDGLGRTPLFMASKSGNYEAVVALVLDGEADIYETDLTNRMTSIHVAKNSQVFDFLLSKIELDEIRKFDPKMELFDKVLRQNPTSMEKLLDKMVLSRETDLTTGDNEFIYDLSLFTNGTTKAISRMDRHNKVIETGYSEFLLHPIMQLFVDMKWHANKRNFFVSFGIFTIFLIFFTAFGLNHIDIIQCVKDSQHLPEGSEEVLKVVQEMKCFEGAEHQIICKQGINDSVSEIDGLENETKVLNDVHAAFSESGIRFVLCPKLECSESTWTLADDHSSANLWEEIFDCLDQTDLKQKILAKKFILIGLKYTTWAALGLLALAELFQILGKLFTGRFCSYFNKQNAVDALILILTTLYFYCVEINEYEWSGHIGGWALFWAWMNFTLFMGKIPKFGRSIFVSMNVAVDICKVFVVYIPSLIAFTLAFHFFLHGDIIFRSFTGGVLKVFVMMIGELDYGDHFETHAVAETGGKQWSTQVSAWR